MKKVTNKINTEWKKAFEQNGFLHHSIDGKYWVDDYHIEISRENVIKLQNASNEVHAMCLELVDENIKKGNFEKYGLPKYIIEAMEKSWNRKDFHLYGRFDFSMVDGQEPKMLEYNADTPVSITESSIGQKIWEKHQKEEFGNNFHGFNNLEKAFKNRFKEFMKIYPNENIYFTADIKTLESWINVETIQSWAKEVGLDAHMISFEEILFNEDNQFFCNSNDEKINNMFKLYPWEFVFKDRNYVDYELSETKFIEPMWKAFISTKAILPMLWEKFEGHKNLLPAYFNEQDIKEHSSKIVKKPIYSREGANIEIVDGNKIIDSAEGKYGVEGYIYQQYSPMTNIDKQWYVFGAWMVGDKVEGLAIREDKTVITKSTSLFVPHNII